MTVGELREVLKNLPDNLPILVEGYDHSYNRISFQEGPARYVKSENYYCEDSGDDADHRPEELPIRALIGN